jgi:hypothetical protein
VTNYDQFIDEQIRQLQAQGKTPEEAAAIVVDAQRLILKVLQKRLEEHGERS